MVAWTLSGCVHAGYDKNPLKNIPNFYQVDETLYRGGQPNEEGLEELKSRGIKTVINLRESVEKISQEEKIATNHGMNFYNIALSVYERPTDEQVLTFLEIVLDKDKQPVFVHCDAGRDRTGAMIALYRVVIEGWGPKQAYEEAKNFGFWPYRGEAELKNFIHQLKDKLIYFEKAKEFSHENY
jgi:protein tyrosine/serine phosphatase